ncbi:GNAT family N-acetyltransferase [Streptacidiphilus neutrinimicus]|uniref:GNAT family N-acetyltransferase n=1 Tax=Streptacidiphilus neutrinimicus TaxID=105420 RepID=UPI0005AADC42|nr:GNAT family N-acetyltransferase [Streptacidiphilus neutrinimicus]
MDEVTVRQVTAGDLGELVRVLARAFYEDPQFLWSLPDQRDRLRRIERIFDTILRFEALRHDTVQLAEDGAGTILGGAVWLPPHHWRDPLSRQLLTAPGFLRGYGRRIGYGGAFQSACWKAHPCEPHWYLYILGVEPDVQGRGVGAALLRAGLERSDAAGLPAYLESSNLANVPLYEHFGFAVTGRLALPPNAPEIPTMWRPTDRVSQMRTDD